MANAAAADLLQDLLKSGRITKDELNLLTANQHRHRCHTITGSQSITISSPSFHELDVAARVFNTGELLVHVLSFLPPIDLLLAPLVCKGFKQAIEASKPLRRILHLEPDTKGPPDFLPFMFKGAYITSADTMQFFIADFAMLDEIRGTRSILHRMLVTQPRRALKIKTGFFRDQDHMDPSSTSLTVYGHDEDLTWGSLIDQLKADWLDPEHMDASALACFIRAVHVPNAIDYDGESEHEW